MAGLAGRDPRPGFPIEQSVAPQLAFERLEKKLTDCLVYYNFVLTIYRPFLVIDSALRSSRKADQIELFWLQPACRQATAAAEDCISLIHRTRQAINVKQVS